MSLPSVINILNEREWKTDTITEAEAEIVLVEAMQRDLGAAVAFLHEQTHRLTEENLVVKWSHDPKSEIGKQLIRLCASDALRPLAEKHFCHENRITFVNCCIGQIGKKPPPGLSVLQIQAQAGPIAYADC